jgi:hypothetical protein
MAAPPADRPPSDTPPADTPPSDTPPADGSPAKGPPAESHRGRPPQPLPDRDLLDEIAAAIQVHPEAALDDIRRMVPATRDIDDDSLREWIAAGRTAGP